MSYNSSNAHLRAKLKPLPAKLKPLPAKLKPLPAKLEPPGCVTDTSKDSLQELQKQLEEEKEKNARLAADNKTLHRKVAEAEHKNEILILELADRAERFKTQEKELRDKDNTIQKLQRIVDRECPVCLESGRPSMSVLSLCGHVFCTDCAMKVFKVRLRGQNARCPLCRRDVISFQWLWLE
jgi:DNA repair exonuclease SbcCD ATPase subunit